MKHLSLGKDGVMVFFVLGILVLISSALVAYLNSDDQLDNGDYIAFAYQRIDIVDKILSNLNQADESRKGYQIYKDQQFIENIQSSKAGIDSLLGLLRSISFDNIKLQGRGDTMSFLISERFRLIDESIDIIKRKNSSSRLLNPIRDRSKIVVSDINSIAKRIYNDERTMIGVKHELADKGHKFTFYTIAGGTLACLIIFISVFVIQKTGSKLHPSEDEEMTRAELEGLVKERTAEISEVNNKLNFKITELEMKDDELKRSVQYYRMLFEQAHDAILILDAETVKVLDVNKRACEIYGLSRDEFIGLSMKSISKNVAMGEEDLRLTLEKEDLHQFQNVHYNKNLNEMLMEINASIIDYNGKKAILSINRDITHRVLMIQ